MNVYDEKQIKQFIDKLTIQEVISNWAFWRDSQDWDNLRTCFHQNATITVSFYSGPIDGFIDLAKTMGHIKHIICNSHILLNGNKAIAESNVIILNRGKVLQWEVDFTGYIRFFDLFENKGSEGWRITKRTAIYEKDRLDVVKPSGLFGLLYPKKKLKSYPEEYKHLCLGLEKRNKTILPTSITTTINSHNEMVLRKEANDWLVS